jgi:hypothetical protein
MVLHTSIIFCYKLQVTLTNDHKHKIKENDVLQ